MRNLEPIKKPDRVLREPYSVCDIEVRDWTRFLMIGHYGSKYRYFRQIRKFFDFVMNEPLLTSQMTPTGIWLLRGTEAKRVIYAHFGGKFDFLFLLDHLYFKTDWVISKIIPRGASLLSFEVTKPGARDKAGVQTEPDRTIIFRDSAAMLPFGLKSLCDNFKVPHPKLDIDHTKVKKVTAKLVRYNMHDCQGLKEVIDTYYQWPIIRKAGQSSTVAGQAMRVLRTMIQTPIAALNKSDTNFVRRAYFGGRAEVFRPLFRGSRSNKISCWDINSLYPTVMRSHEYPGACEGWTKKYQPKKHGVYEATVLVPKNMWIPPLGTNVIVNGVQKLIFPVGKFSGVWTTWELEYAKSLGVKVLKIGKGLTFQNAGPFFREYVDRLYAIRENSSKDSVDNVLAKLLLNSLYGRFGLKLERESVDLDRGQVGVEPLMELGVKGRKIRLVKEPKTIQSFTNVAVACFVTAAARIHMHKRYRRCGQELYYTDTDSLFSRKRFASSSRLGGLKKEYSAEASCFLLPKTYLADGITGLKSKEGKNITKKVVMKGFETKKIKHFTFDDFCQALEGDLRRLKIVQAPKFATFRTAVRKGKFVTMTHTANAKGEPSTRQIHARYDKRILFKNKGGEWSSRPIELHGKSEVKVDNSHAMEQIAQEAEFFFEEFGVC